MLKKISVIPTLLGL